MIMAETVIIAAMTKKHVLPWHSHPSVAQELSKRDAFRQRNFLSFRGESREEFSEAYKVGVYEPIVI